MEASAPELPQRFLKSWTAEPATRDEGHWTEGGEGWQAWNGKSAEREFVDFAGALVALLRPRLVIETGVGQGYATRRLASALPHGASLLGFESDPAFRGALSQLSFFDGVRVRLSERKGPTSTDVRSADLLVLDSTTGQRIREIDLWLEVGRSGSFALVHDVSPGHPDGSIHRRLAAHIAAVLPEEAAGVLLPNPRGGWLACKA